MIIKTYADNMGDAMSPQPKRDNPPAYLVFLVNSAGQRAQVCIQRYNPGVALRNVQFNAGTTYARFVILREHDMVQVYASHPDDSNGAYLPPGATR